MVKAKPQDFKEKHRDKDLKLKLKKENTEANVKHAELKKKKGEFYYFMQIQKGEMLRIYICNRSQSGLQGPAQVFDKLQEVYNFHSLM